MLVYLITNHINGKCYVGKTSQPLAKRWSHHKYMATRSRQLLYLAMNKYGFSNFSISVLESAGSTEELNGLEAYYIQRLSTCNPQFGYNMTLGGDGAPTGERNHWFGTTGPMGGRKRSLESNKLISNALRGRPKSEQHRRRAAEAKRKHWGNLKQVIELRSNGKSFREIGHRFGMSDMTARRMCYSQGVR